MTSLPPQNLYLCLDGGGTKTRAVISRKTPGGGGAEIVAEGLAAGSNLAEAGLTVCVQELKLATNRAIAALPTELLPSTFTHPASTSSPSPTTPQSEICTILFQNIWVGLSGADNPPDIVVLSRPLTAFYKTTPHIQNDALLLSSPLLRVGAKTGVLVVAGTGSVCVSVHQDSATGEMEAISRRGGLGFLLGDEGSAFSFGRVALRSVLYAYDDGTLDLEAPFLIAFLKYWGVEDVAELLAKVYWLPEGLVGGEGENYRKLKIAESARVILAHACPAPDAPFPISELALSVVESCANELALDISRLLLPHPKGLDPKTSMLSLGGSLVAQPGYQALVLKSLKEDFGVVFGFGCEHVADAAGNGAKVLALKG